MYDAEQWRELAIACAVNPSLKIDRNSSSLMSNLGRPRPTHNQDIHQK